MGAPQVSFKLFLSKNIGEDEKTYQRPGCRHYFHDLTLTNPVELNLNTFCFSILAISVADPMEFGLSCFEDHYEKSKTTTSKLIWPAPVYPPIGWVFHVAKEVKKGEFGWLTVDLQKKIQCM